MQELSFVLFLVCDFIFQYYKQVFVYFLHFIKGRENDVKTRPHQYHYSKNTIIFIVHIQIISIVYNVIHTKQQLRSPTSPNGCSQHAVQLIHQTRTGLQKHFQALFNAVRSGTTTFLQSDTALETCLSAKILVCEAKLALEIFRSKPQDPCPSK